MTIEDNTKEEIVKRFDHLSRLALDSMERGENVSFNNGYILAMKQAKEIVESEIE